MASTEKIKECTEEIKALLIKKYDLNMFNPEVAILQDVRPVFWHVDGTDEDQSLARNRIKDGTMSFNVFYLFPEVSLFGALIDYEFCLTIECEPGRNVTQYINFIKARSLRMKNSTKKYKIDLSDYQHPHVSGTTNICWGNMDKDYRALRALIPKNQEELTSAIRRTVELANVLLRIGYNRESVFVQIPRLMESMFSSAIRNGATKKELRDLVIDTQISGFNEWRDTRISQNVNGEVFKLVGNSEKGPIHLNIVLGHSVRTRSKTDLITFASSDEEERYIRQILSGDCADILVYPEEAEFYKSEKVTDLSWMFSNRSVANPPVMFMIAPDIRPSVFISSLLRLFRINEITDILHIRRHNAIDDEELPYAGSDPITILDFGERLKKYTSKMKNTSVLPVFLGDGFTELLKKKVKITNLGTANKFYEIYETFMTDTSAHTRVELGNKLIELIKGEEQCKKK